jgi:hypothetical protein
MTTIHSRKNVPSKAAGEKVVVRNASTGAFVRISDPAIKPRVERLKKELSKDPEAAQRFMEKVGYLTPKGKVSARYA